MQFYLLVLLFAACAEVTLTTYGVDVDVPVSKDRWRCIKRRAKHAYDFAIVQIFNPFLGTLIRSAAPTIKNARAAGISRVDGYISPDTFSRPQKGQVRDALESIRKNGADIDHLWLEIGVHARFFEARFRKQNTINFIQLLVDEAKSMNMTVGIHTKRSQWKEITNNSDQFKSLPLWYVHLDDKPTFSDFKSFGGWTKPTMKQYKALGHTSVCEVKVSKDWFP